MPSLWNHRKMTSWKMLIDTTRTHSPKPSLPTIFRCERLLRVWLELRTNFHSLFRKYRMTFGFVCGFHTCIIPPVRIYSDATMTKITAQNRQRNQCGSQYCKSSLVQWKVDCASGLTRKLSESWTSDSFESIIFSESKAHSTNCAVWFPNLWL